MFKKKRRVEMKKKRMEGGYLCEIEGGSEGPCGEKDFLVGKKVNWLCLFIMRPMATL